MLIDVPGLALGHASLGDTGVTVVRAVDPAGVIAAVDVRGGGPGTRETDLLAPHNTVERVHALVLTGGSAFGLAAADGVMTGLAQRGVGFPVLGEDHPLRVPIVPAAVIFDLLVGSPERRPTAIDGAAALADSYSAAGAGSGPGSGPGSGTGSEHSPASGSVGAGCGATAGRLRGGLGQASTKVGDYTVAALVVANPQGEVVDPATGLLYGDPGLPPVDLAAFGRLVPQEAKLNTTIGVVATDAPVTVAQAQRLAMTGHDGIARAVRPAHSPLDGDTLFTVSTGTGAGVGDVLELTALCAAAAEMVQAAIVDGVTKALPGTQSYGVTAYREIA